MAEEKILKPLSGWWVFAAFVSFFAIIIAVNAVFITMAIQSNSGLVTEDAYKKGLSFNETLKEAKNQPNINSEITFEDGVIRCSLYDPSGAAINNAHVAAKFTRPVKDGDDFSGLLRYEGNGLYSIKPDFPLKGIWKLQLSAVWDKQTYKTATEIIVR